MKQTAFLRCERRVFAVAFFVLLLIGGQCFISCGHSTEKQLVAVTDSFSLTYFNWQYQRALPFCTVESEPWLRYMASQVNQTDVDSLVAQDESATCEVGDIEYDDGDSTARVEVQVKHFLYMDTLGRVARPMEQGRFVIPVKLKKGSWKVNLSAPLRPEKD